MYRLCYPPMGVTMPVETINQLERTPLTSTESLRVRCPECRKLYLVQYADIQEVKPRFECVQCRSRFWLSLSDIDLSSEIFGIPVQIKEPPLRAKATEHKNVAKEQVQPCPKCGHPTQSGLRECVNCGVVIEKFKAGLQSPGALPAHSRSLELLWKKVIAEYGDESLHNEFLRACQRERNLAYASAQYAQMQRLMPSDEITARRLKELRGLGLSVLPTPESGRSLGVYPRLWQVPLFGATLLIIVGMVSPMFRNMVGVGAAFLFLAIAMRIQLRKRG